MTEIPKNKLWALPTTGKNLALQETFAHFYSDADHILIVSPTAPNGAKEVTPDLEYLLTQADLLWIWNESMGIQREEELKYRKELDDYMRSFEERFLAELEIRKKGGAEIGNNADGADGSSHDNKL